MKFVSGIVFIAFIAGAIAEEVRSPELVPTTPESPANVRDKRGFILSTYAAPIAAVPVAQIATEETTKKPEIANLLATIEKTETVETAPVATVPVAAPAIAGYPYAYTYSAAVPYAYPAYRAYVPYYPTFVY